MNHTVQTQGNQSHPLDLFSRIKKFWRQSGGRFLFLSILVHLILAIGATYFVIQKFSQKQKLAFKGGEPGHSSSQRALEHKVQMAKKQKTMTSPVVSKRIVSTGLARVSLPEMPAMSQMNAAAPVAASAGNVMGGGFSAGKGGGMGGGGTAIPFFGLRSLGGGVLSGNFYDLKQTPDRKPTGMTPQLYAKEITSFIKGNWNPSYFNRFFKAPNTLYNTQVFVPDIPADIAPKAFGVEKEVKPMMWVVHYKGMVTPPESGTYHFVGQGDDILLVKFDGKLVLVACWNNSSFGIVETKWKPQEIYKCWWPKNCPSGGLVKGNGFEVLAGSTYPVEILIGEQPGGRGAYALMIEKDGVKYGKDGAGVPLLPVFRLADSKIPPLEKGESLPPYDPKGPIWKGVMKSNLESMFSH